jgi:ADP-heptose:LPS heptosyltransferase
MVFDNRSIAELAMEASMGHAATKKVLLIRSDRLGDFLAITPVIRAVRAYFKDARIDFLASDISAEAAQANPHLDNVYVLRQRSPFSWPGLVRQLRKQRYDLILCLNAESSKAAFFTWCAGAAQSYGWAGISKYAKYFDHFFLSKKYAHITKNQLSCLGKLGIPSAGEALELPVPVEAKECACAGHPRIPGKKRLAVFIGNAKKLHSRWPTEKFALLAEILLSVHPDLEIYIVHGKAEVPLLALFQEQDRLKLFSANLMETAAFLITCDALLTSSSGPWHMAAAVGTPTLGIVCRYNYDNWRPLEGRHYFVLPDNDSKDVRPVEIEPVRKMVEDFLWGQEVVV